MPIFVNEGDVVNERGLRIRRSQVDRGKNLVRLKIRQDRINNLETRTRLDL